MNARTPAALVLEDGRVFPGAAYGARGRTLGEAVFCTGNLLKFKLDAMFLKLADHEL